MTGCAWKRKGKRLNIIFWGLIAADLLGLLGGCTAPTPTMQAVFTVTVVTSASAAASPTFTPAATRRSPTPSAVPTVTPIPTLTQPSPTPGPRICSPLEGVSLQELPDMVAGNTFQTPMPDRDSGHPGVDFAFYRHGDRTTMLGLPLQAAMDATVAAVLPDRMPYGNAVILEVPLENVPETWLPSLNWPTPAPAVKPDARLTCPDPLALPAWDTSHRSLYLMYGHLNQPSSLHPGDSVSCGQVIGEAGTTGASVNPHLHFETRLGPANFRISSLGHYDPTTTDEERNNYCLWRVSGWFQVVDPLALLAQQP